MAPLLENRPSLGFHKYRLPWPRPMHLVSTAVFPSSEFESESEEESQDKLGLDDKDEQLSPEYFLQEAESLDMSQLRFCKGAKRDPVECLSQLSNTEKTVRFLKAFFSWRWFAEVARPYCLRYSAAKAFNDSQRKQWKTQEKIVKKLQKKYKHAEEQYDRSVKQLRNEKGRQRHCLIRENLERYKNEQPVIDSERQLSEKIVNEEVKVALESTGSITPQYITLIDTVLTIPGATTEKEYKRRIAAINAVIAVCNAEEGSPSRPPTSKKRCVNYIDTSPADLIPKRQKPAASDIEDDVFSQAIASVCVKSPEERPTICFICLGNPMLPGSERLRKFKNSGSLSRHFVNKHIKPYSNSIQYECTIYGEQLSSKSALLNHAQGSHRIVSCLPLPVLGLPLPGKPSFD
ncbi:hypothetical protein PENVUL_c041G05915 [Penicillium vulpinum]|uniref:C2H2-type domain-containing protein n=1 Tax=Penicillium vulpinum TaxID=29845 RepID=A0A1V6RK18_9EURO|nr:hypothetical protein PENVUL_c041G05915 [Penicillium vulpinum]